MVEIITSVLKINNRTPTTTYKKDFCTNGGIWTNEERHLAKTLLQIHYPATTTNITKFSHICQIYFPNRSIQAIRSQFNDIKNNKYVDNPFKGLNEIHKDSLSRKYTKEYNKDEKHMRNQINYSETTEKRGFIQNGNTS